MLMQKNAEAAVREARLAEALAPRNAQVLATLCLALRESGLAQEAEPHCRAALEIADRVFPEYQFLTIREVRIVAEQEHHDFRRH
jgi:hypothetical protein